MKNFEIKEKLENGLIEQFNLLASWNKDYIKKDTEQVRLNVETMTKTYEVLNS